MIKISHKFDDVVAIKLTQEIIKKIEDLINFSYTLGQTDVGIKIEVDDIDDVGFTMRCVKWIQKNDPEFCKIIVSVK